MKGPGKTVPKKTILVKQDVSCRGPKDHINIRIPQTMASGILLLLGIRTRM